MSVQVQRCSKMGRVNNVGGLLIAEKLATTTHYKRTDCTMLCCVCIQVIPNVVVRWTYIGNEMYADPGCDC